MSLPSRPPGDAPSFDARARLRAELDPLAALYRRLSGAGRLTVAVEADVLQTVTGDASATELEIGEITLAVAPVEASAAPLERELAPLVTRTAALVAELARAHARMRELEELSVIDPLTGLRNRRFLDQILPYEIDRRRRYQRALTVMMLDLDRFKRVNDAHGHDAGDAVMRALADVLRGSLRRADVAVRYGGEEFAAVLPETAGEQAAIVAERIRRATEALDVGGIRVTASIGVASVEGGWEGDAAALIRAADQALYRAKRDGRNRVVHANLGEGSVDGSVRIEPPHRLDRRG